MTTRVISGQKNHANVENVKLQCIPQVSFIKYQNSHTS